MFAVRFKALFAQIGLLLLGVAVGVGLTVTVTVAVASGQPLKPLTAYVSTPPVCVAGSKVLLIGNPPESVQTPPVCGEPPSCAKRSNVEAVLHTVILPFVPALEGELTLTVVVPSVAH